MTRHTLSERHTHATDLEADATIRCEVAVIGLGAGGSMVFHDLARAGVDVVALELGEYMPPEAMTRREEQMLPQLFMEGASRATQDMSIRVLQGRGVGGSTLHNTNLCKRLPRRLLEQWAATHGLVELCNGRLQQTFAEVEELLGVHIVPDERTNTNNRILARGRQKLGWRGGRLKHNRQGCKQSGFCELGCPNNGKQNAAKVLVPAGLEAGGRVITEARVERLHARRGDITHATVRAIEADTREERHTFIVRADTFVVAASATGSAALVQRSELPDPHRLAGTNLHMHPGAFVVGLFDEKVEAWRGVPQAEDCTEFLSQVGSDRGRAWIVSGAAHPAGAASLLPGFGRAHGEMMRQFPHAASAISMLHDHSSGRVQPSEGEHVGIHYRLSKEDWEYMLMGMKQAARIFLAAGAREVVLPLRPARHIRTESDLRDVTVGDVGPFSPGLVAVHPMSTLWMGADPRSSVVDVRGRHHHIHNLYVGDGSLFPTSIGGPPQIPIYTFGRHVAHAILEDR